MGFQRSPGAEDVPAPVSPIDLAPPRPYKPANSAQLSDSMGPPDFPVDRHNRSMLAV